MFSRYLSTVMFLLTALIDFLKDQITKLLKFEFGASHSDKEKSIIIGISCLFYGFPAIVSYFYLFQVRWCWYLETGLYIVTTICSFIADYIVFGKMSLFHAIDRWTATTTSLLTLYKCIAFQTDNFRLVLFLICWIFGLTCITKSRKSKTQFSFMAWHFIWHVLTSFSLCCLIMIELVDKKPHVLLQDQTILHTFFLNCFSNNQTLNTNNNTNFDCLSQ